MNIRRETTARRIIAAMTARGFKCQFSPPERLTSLVVNGIAYPCVIEEGFILLRSGVQNPVTKVREAYIAIQKRWKRRWHDGKLCEILGYGAQSKVEYDAWIARTRWCRVLADRLQAARIGLKIVMAQDVSSDGRIQIGITGEKVPQWQYCHLVQMWIGWVSQDRNISMAFSEPKGTLNLVATFDRHQAEELVQDLIDSGAVDSVMTC